MISAVSRQLALMLATLLVACAGPVTRPDEQILPRSAVKDFSLEARFAVTHEAERYSGRLSWRHRASDDALQIISPFGQVLVEIDINRTRAQLITSDQRAFEAPDAALLTQDVLGYPLPISQLASWVLARSAGNKPAMLDGSGRPQQIEDGGWKISYEYEGESADALPSRVTAYREGGPELKLRIEEWRTP